MIATFQLRVGEFGSQQFSAFAEPYDDMSYCFISFVINDLWNETIRTMFVAGS